MDGVNEKNKRSFGKDVNVSVDLGWSSGLYPAEGTKAPITGLDNTWAT